MTSVDIIIEKLVKRGIIEPLDQAHHITRIQQVIRDHGDIDAYITSIPLPDDAVKQYLAAHSDYAMRFHGHKLDDEAQPGVTIRQWVESRMRLEGVLAAAQEKKFTCNDRE